MRTVPVNSVLEGHVNSQHENFARTALYRKMNGLISRVCARPDLPHDGVVSVQTSDFNLIDFPEWNTDGGRH